MASTDTNSHDASNNNPTTGNVDDLSHLSMNPLDSNDNRVIVGDVPKLKLNEPESLWSPTKRLNKTTSSLKAASPAGGRTIGTRKLSESRGVNLPELKLHSSTHNTNFSGVTGLNKFGNKRSVGFGSSISAPSGTKQDRNSSLEFGIRGAGRLSNNFSGYASGSGSGGNETDDTVGYASGNGEGPNVEEDSSALDSDPPPPTGSPVGHFTRRPGFPAPLSAPLTDSFSGAAVNASRSLLDLCIFLPDRRGIQFTVEGGRLASASCLLSLMFTHRNLPHLLAGEAFALWLVSPLLEVQLKPHHVPFQVRRAWPDLLRRFTSVTKEVELEDDEPLLVFRRNVLLSIDRQSEIMEEHEGIADSLYADAAESIFSARCLCSLEEAIAFGATKMALDWGPYNKNQHTTAYIRDRLDEVLPSSHVPDAKSWSILGWSPVSAWCRGLENELLDQYKQISIQRLPAIELKKKYLQMTMELPTYGSAIFDGQVERPGHLWGTIRADDLPVRIAINLRYITVVDGLKSAVLLCQSILDCSWRKINPPEPANPHCFPSFFLHFPDPTNQAYSKLLQIFSKQAVMMEALLNSCIDVFLLQNDGEPQSASMTPGMLPIPPQPFRDNTIITKAVAESDELRGYSQSSFDDRNQKSCGGEDMVDGGGPNGQDNSVKRHNRYESRLPVDSSKQPQTNGVHSTKHRHHVAFMRGLSGNNNLGSGGDEIRFGKRNSITRHRNDRSYVSSSGRMNRLERLCLATIDVETGECVDAVGSLQDCLKDDE